MRERSTLEVYELLRFKKNYEASITHDRDRSFRKEQLQKPNVVRLNQKTNHQIADGNLIDFTDAEGVNSTNWEVLEGRVLHDEEDDQGLFFPVPKTNWFSSIKKECKRIHRSAPLDLL